MGREDNGLTLEALAQRLEGLQRENAKNAERLQTLERENDELMSKVTTLEGSGARRERLAEMRGSERRLAGEAVSALEGRVSRRSLLSKAGAAAVAAMATGMLLNPREANAHHYFGTPDDDVFTANEVHAHFFSAEIDNEAAPGVESLNEGSGPGVWGRSVRGVGVKGIANAITGVGVEGRATGSLGYGVRGEGFSGVWGEASHADGRGVMGLNPNGTGVKGQGNTGVLGVGFDERQAGVKGEGPTGVWGKSSRSNFAAVYGQHTGTTGMGVLGIGTGIDAGVAGENPNATGIGTYGECWGGTGVKGVSQSGYAGVFEGGKAQLMLKPGGSAGKPSGAHSKGEIYMDSAGTLFVCVVGGNPAKWRKFSTTAV